MQTETGNQYALKAFVSDGPSYHLKAELKRANVTYDQLAERLEAHGFEEKKASIANKLARATITASFFMAALAALEMEGVRLEDI